MARFQAERQMEGRKKERAENKETQGASRIQLKKQPLECSHREKGELKGRRGTRPDSKTKVSLPPAMAVFLPTVTVTAVAAITIFPVGTTAQLAEQHHHH